jgi:hypothetical protein
VGSPLGDLTLTLYSAPLNATYWHLGVNGQSNLGNSTKLAAAMETPTTLVATSQLYSASWLDTAYGWAEFVFAARPVLTAGLPYWLVLSDSAGVSMGNHVEWGAQVNPPSYPYGWLIGEQSSVWQLESATAAFEVYGG